MFAICALLRLSLVVSGLEVFSLRMDFVVAEDRETSCFGLFTDFAVREVACSWSDSGSTLVVNALLENVVDTELILVAFLNKQGRQTYV